MAKKYDVQAAGYARRMLAGEFNFIFDVLIVNYWDKWTGLDVAKLDDDVIHSLANQSIHDAILERFGERALWVIEVLIGVEEYKRRKI